MARPLRLEFPGGLYHVISRGNARQAIFLDDRDRLSFLDVLGLVVERYYLLCHAYCLMENHYHLLVETPDGKLSLPVRYLNGVYSQSFNRRHARVGHLFQGRFRSIIVQKDSYLLELCRYIVLNPVRAGLVPGPGDWPWSSYRAHAGLSAPPAFLSAERTLGIFDPLELSKAQVQYREFVALGMATHGIARPAVEGKPILGRQGFVSGLRPALAGAAPLREIPRAQRFAARPRLPELFHGCGSKQDRNKRMREAYLLHGYTMREIADHLELHYMTVSRAVRSQKGPNVGM